MSVLRSEIVADIRRYVGDDGATIDDDYRFNDDDLTAAIQLSVNRIFDDCPAYLYDTAIVLAAPTVASTATSVPVTSGGRLALGRLAAYFLLVEDKEDANNLAVAGTHYELYERERMKT